ncbi:hypothetical protein LCGC14_0577200 [marine sediment metagenome]|uniref:Uncharacterized protein n=1 Tax=marine sediment metagenome TaxID=412755 RepID=A0A0F9UQV3_9ZZZZ|nr:hypothetical protein [bacterium]
MIKENQIQLIQELENYHHGFLNKEGCEYFLQPFGITAKLDNVKANPQDFKGLALWDNNGKSIKEAKGLSGLDISSLIAVKLNVVTLNLFGRGSQHRSNCEAIVKKLKV